MDGVYPSEGELCTHRATRAAYVPAAASARRRRRRPRAATTAWPSAAAARTATSRRGPRAARGRGAPGPPCSCFLPPWPATCSRSLLLPESRRLYSTQSEMERGYENGWPWTGGAHGQAFISTPSVQLDGYASIRRRGTLSHERTHCSYVCFRSSCQVRIWRSDMLMF